MSKVNHFLHLEAFGNDSDRIALECEICRLAACRACHENLTFGRKLGGGRVCLL